MGCQCDSRRDGYRANQRCEMSCSHERTPMSRWRDLRQPRYAVCGLVGTTITVGPSTSSAFVNSRASFSQLSTLTVRHPNPVAMEAMSSPGRSIPGTPGVSSSTANDLRIEYSSLRMTTNTTGSWCWAAVYIACTEYWQDPSPMVASTVRLTPRARSPSARPTAAGKPHPIPPLAVAKKDAGRVVGIQCSCCAIVDVDSVTNGESAGFTEARVDHTASGASGGEADQSTAGLRTGAAGTFRSLWSSIMFTSCSRASSESPSTLSPTGAAAARAGSLVICSRSVPSGRYSPAP